MQIFKSFTPEVVELLKNGAVGIIPTDTIYGVATCLFNQESVERLYQIKRREKTKPVGTILINDPFQIEHITEPKELRMAQVYWPGPTSVIIPVSHKLDYAHKGYDSLPFRIPAVKELSELIAQTGPLATSSANFSGQPPATTLQDAISNFRELVDFYVDGGDLSLHKPSKIIRFDDSGEVEIIRGE